MVARLRLSLVTDCTMVQGKMTYRLIKFKSVQENIGYFNAFTHIRIAQSKIDLLSSILEPSQYFL